MPLQNHILDNQAAAVGDFLRRNLRGADAFDLASAYFTIYGYGLLAEELDRVGSVRFLFGSPTSVEDLDPGANDPNSFELTEQGMEPNHTLQQRALAQRCAQWVRRDTVVVRSVSRANFLHGKMYLNRVAYRQYRRGGQFQLHPARAGRQRPAQQGHLGQKSNGCRGP